MSEQNDTLTKLTYKRRVFIEAYLELWNATKAADKAGYANPGQQGHSLLKIHEIQQAIETRLNEMAMPANEVLSRLSEQAKVNVGDFVDKETYIDEDGITISSVRLDWDMVKSHGHLIKKITHNQYGPIIELHDGQAALVHIGRHHKLFTDKTELTGKDGADLIPKVTDAEHKRAISTLADALGTIIHGEGAETDGVMDAPE